MKYIFTLIFLLLMLTKSTNAQFYQTGQDPSRIQWRQINTQNFQVIYPEEFEKEAQRLTFVLTKVYEYSAHSMNHAPNKISVVLHTRTANSNGLVAWAPKRMELFTTPNQQMYSQDWLNQLALHEFRHLVQMDKIQSELPSLLKLILGEQATALVTGVYLPLWFLEGDAVVNETALSPTGRGRQASFNMEYRARLLEKGLYSFSKAYLGSYKDFVPDYYKLGYLMVAKTREKYGAQLWTDVVKRAGSDPLSITPLNTILKRQTGLNSLQLYRQVFDDLTKEWKQEMTTVNDEVLSVSPKRKAYTSYYYPSFFKDSLIVAYRTSMDNIGRFVLIHSNGREEVVYTPGYIYEESANVTGPLIIWAERQPDIRWTHAERSVISTYDITAKKKQRFPYENKLFSPVVSPDLQSFAAIETDKQNKIYLSVFDLLSGELKHRYKSPDNDYLFTPCWDEKGEKLYLVGLSPQGKYLSSCDLLSGKYNQLTTPTFADIKNPIYTNNQLIFSGDFQGKDDLYSMDTQSGKIYHIFSSAFGADYPSAVNNKGILLFSNYTADGYQLSTLDMKDKSHWQPVTDLSLQPNKLADHLKAQEQGIPDLQNTDSINYPSSKYSKSSHLFNFHSWAPAYIDVDNYELRPGISFLSQNVLGTADTRIGYDYDVANKTGKGVLVFNYYGLFPEFNGSLSYGNGKSSHYQITETVDRFNHVVSRDSSLNNYNWNELAADIGLRLPLNLSRGKYSIGLYPEIKYNFSYLKPLRFYGDNVYSGDYHALTYRLYHFNLIHQYAQSLMPKWGYQLDMIYRHTPFGAYRQGTIKGVQSSVYLPGLLKNNGIKIYQGYQVKTFSATSTFSNFVHFPRGIQNYTNNRMYSLSVDYRMPLVYPDVSVGKLLYLKRVKTSLFYDYAWVSSPAFTQNHTFIPNYYQFALNSTGMDLTADFHVLRSIIPLQAGLRSVYLPQSGKMVFEFLFSVDFNGF
ncbi:MAG: hypothetical protein ACM3P1_06920 [Candidatus Saccharibacteria bacterium]